MTKSNLYALLAATLSLWGSGSCAAPPSPAATTRPVSDSGWRLWLDPKASWQNDTLYLPDEVHLNSMPVNPPTGGWGVLSNSAGIGVSLPGTVEEHYWSKSPAHVLDPNNPRDIVGGSGGYLGVSWWYRTFTPPSLKPGERLVFSFPGARLRAEVYVNGKLCGYDAITETAFTADATAALKPGQPNQLAIRITNPGGNYSWPDFDLFQWGKYQIPVSHTFGGLDAGITMTIQGPVAITDLAVLNNPNPKTITFQTQVTSTGPEYNGPVALTITREGNTAWSGTINVRVPAGKAATVTKTVTVPSAVLWDINKPILYQAKAAIPSIAHSDRQQSFGFRWFTVKGLGKNATLTLNGRRVVVKSSISWGFWSPNGMFPDKAAVAREISALQKLGLNAIQNHRHMPKPVVMRTFDEAGLLRYCEPGAGCFTFSDPPSGLPTSGLPDTSGRGGEPTTFANKYELYKLLAMIKENRSHPSAIIWSLQNEVSADHHNPKIYYTLHKMREADPSRIIMLESGFSTQDQVWAMPYSNELLVDKGKGSGWNDNHSADESRGVYQDSYYKSPTDYKYHSDNTTEVRVWGEMATGASPDGHGVIADWYRKNNRTGYDRDAHIAINAAYENFIDKFSFRSAFPTASDLFRKAADKHYLMDARMMENTRMSDVTDYIVLSGWESTVQDNHSGMVDAQRNLKTNPAIVKAAAEPAALAVRALHYVLEPGTTASVDVHLFNENVLRGSYTLRVTARQGSAAPFYNSSFPVSVTGGERFAQLLRKGITFTPRQTGPVSVTATLTPAQGKGTAITKSDQLFVVNTHPASLSGPVAVIGSPELATALRKQFHIEASPYTSAPPDAKTIVLGVVSENYDAGSNGSWTLSTTNKGDINGAPDPGIYAQQYYGRSKSLVRYSGLANGTARVTLYFIEPYFNGPGKRIFDMALNDQTVVQNLDIYKESGGKNSGISKTFDVAITKGSLSLTIPKVATDNAIISALEITDAQGKKTRAVFGDNAYKDSVGNVWASVKSAEFDWSMVPADVLTRVKEGARLVFLSNNLDSSDTQQVAQGLAQQSVLTYSGMIGDPGPAWLGSWYFAKKHWLLRGLPTDTVCDWQYQITWGNGLEIDAPGIDGVMGYSVHHEPRVGLGAAVIPYGKGQIVLFCIPGLAQSFVDSKPEGIHPVTAKRIIYNSLAGPDRD